MSEVKRYHVTEAGLVEGQALGRINVVLGTDYDQVTARLKEGVTKHWKIVCDQRAKIDALQALLTAADEKNDTLTTAYLSAGVREHLLRLRVDVLEQTLKFYADREHYHFESGNWDTVSGEPLNILWNGDEPDFIEDGSVARTALKPAEVIGSTCNQIREETGLPINRPCKACNGGSCIDK